MSPDIPPTESIDGIASAPVMKESETPPVQPGPSNALSDAQKKSRSRAILILSVLGFLTLLYFFFAVFLLLQFPTRDGSGAGLKSIGNTVLLIGLLLAGFLGALGMLRIGTVRDSKQKRVIALVRLLIGVLPILFISGISLFMINREPVLLLELLSPKEPDALVAPLSVTFGMPITMQIFKQQNLVPLKYQWDFTGDGRIDQETFDPQATFIISRSGVYPIRATITMTNGQQKKANLRLVIPRQSFAVEPMNPVIDDPAQFSVESLIPGGEKAPTLLKAKWDFEGDGIVDLDSDKAIATNVYRKLGEMNVSVTLVFSNQTQTSFARQIEVIKPPEQPFQIVLEAEPTTLLGPPPFGAVFTLKTKEPIANAAWDFGDQKTGEGLRIAHVFSSVGSYAVTATIRSQSGATAKLSKLVRITNPFTLSDLIFQGKPEVKSFTIEGEVPLTVDITPITSQPLISFSWDAQNATEVLATDKSFHAVYRDAGRYFLDLIAIDPDQNVFRKRIIVNAKSPQSVVNFTMDPPTPTAPASVTFDASDTYVPSGEEITGFVWDYGDSRASGGNADGKFSGSRITHLFENPGTYTVTLSVRTTSNQLYTGKQTLVVKAPIIDACFMPSRTNGKAPLGVFFDDSCSAGDFVSRLWDFADGSQSDQPSPTHVFTKPGTYVVTLVSTTKDGRRSSKTATITVTAP